MDCVGESSILLATETTNCVWEAGGSAGEHASTSLSQFRSVTGSFILDTNASHCLSSNNMGLCGLFLMVIAP